MNEVPVWRLNALRAGYLLLVVGLGLTVWPTIIHRATPWSLSGGVVHCMLGAMSALAVLGLRHPLKMLPLLFFELGWKAIWLLAVATPLWWTHRMDADTLETADECLIAVVFIAVIPWRYVFNQYVAASGDRWSRGGATPRTPSLAGANVAAKAL